MFTAAKYLYFRVHVMFVRPLCTLSAHVCDFILLCLHLQQRHNSNKQQSTNPIVGCKKLIPHIITWWTCACGEICLACDL